MSTTYDQILNLLYVKFCCVIQKKFHA